jgi:CO/xanthine dehydrogenase Mo-binding subunit
MLRLSQDSQIGDGRSQQGIKGEFVMEKELTIVGKRYPKIDGWERVSGKAVYASDIYLPGMLYAKILRSPHPHARILNIDAGKAKALAGVKAVLTAKDITDFSWDKNPGRSHHDMPILADTARFAGDDIAVVAAVDEDLAEEALDLIKVDYQPLPFVLDPEEALKPTAPKIYAKGNLALYGVMSKKVFKRPIWSMKAATTHPCCSTRAPSRACAWRNGREAS